MMVDQELLQAIGQMMDTKLEPIQQDISSLKTDVSSLKTDVSSLKMDVSSLKAKVNQMETDLTRVAVMQENEILTRVKLLAEGQSGLVEKMKKVDEHERRLEDVETKVDAVTIVTRQLQKQRHSPERER